MRRGRVDGWTGGHGRGGHLCRQMFGSKKVYECELLSRTIPVVGCRGQYARSRRAVLQECGLDTKKADSGSFDPWADDTRGRCETFSPHQYSTFTLLAPEPEWGSLPMTDPTTGPSIRSIKSHSHLISP
uniref:Uncharacterized protein n=1 Tax=Knipowitschia caucasica TaxID=637954 RepID=A0AAV2KWH9_KNICA